MNDQKKALRILETISSEVDSFKTVSSEKVLVVAELIRKFVGDDSELFKAVKSLGFHELSEQEKKKRLKSYVTAAMVSVEAFGIHKKDKRNLLDGETNTKIISIGFSILFIGFSAGVGFSELKNMLFRQDENHIENKYKQENKGKNNVDTIEIRPNGRQSALDSIQGFH